MKKKEVYFVTFIFLSLILVGFAALLGWATVGRLEESVAGQGEIVPEGKYRVIRSPFDGMVTSMSIKENSTVSKGQILLALDPAPDKIEKNNYSEQMELLQREANVLQASMDEGDESASGSWVQAARQAHRAKAEAARMQVEKYEHMLQESEERLGKTGAMLSNSQVTLAKYQNLLKVGGVSEYEAREYEKKVLDQQGEVAALRQEIEARKAGLAQAREEMTQVTSMQQEETMNRLNTIQRQMTALSHDRQRISLTEKHHVLKSPIDGIVNQQIIRGAGDIVAAGEKLLSLVPRDARMVAEVKVSNKDLSYIHAHQRAALRVDAFPYQKFGRLMGSVESISPTTQTDEEGHPYYIVRIIPDHQYFEKNGKHLPLRAGMTLSTDIITRSKSIISFVTEPFKIKLDFALRDPSTRY